MLLKNRAYWAWSYVDEKFDGAVDTLATSFAPNWQRMHFAMGNLIALLPAHFPDADIHERFERLMNEARAFGPLMIGEKVFQGSIEHTLRRRKRNTLERYAREILALHDEVRRRRGQYEEALT